MAFVLLVISVITALAGIVFGILVARRAAYERVLKALDYVVATAAASARHRFGSRALLLEYDTPEDEDQALTVEQLFLLLWAARQVYAVWRSLGPKVLSRGPRTLLEDSLRDWVLYMTAVAPQTAKTRLDRVAESIGALLDDNDRLPVTLLANEWKLGRAS